ncbi:acyl-CoA dehydrogenase family protein [Nonomuraea sp. SYSU D8015]|uniref:acyl-CoA dehydrogenase family protein n=1 Tax=Nonomuraea sp. SYSU D8015 TaxID=2593644 RepID=UPI0016609D91|nr:acyl-CoA dehydrogenase family protein [Nonomuraea sp. SYSU D8015]
MRPQDATGICAELARGVLARHAAEVDRDARFPKEAVDALRAHGLLAAAAPAERGGLGADVPTLARMATALARGCGATAMIWAMHQVQIACLLAANAGGELAEAVTRVVHDQLLVASATSEAGIGGALRTSACAVEREGAAARLDKRATTVSYGVEADALLVSARRGPGSPPADQVAVLVDTADAHLEVLGGWNPLGMRGTCSPALRIRAGFEHWRILPAPFGDLVARVMTPLSHVLWSGVWYGLAAEAADRAVSHTRARGDAGGPPSGSLAEMRWRLAGLEAQLGAAAAETQDVLTGAAEPTVAFTLRVNSLKLAVSQNAVDVGLAAMRVCGMAGYSEEGSHSVARLLRDLLSAPLMINNERLVAIGSQLALVARER